MTHPLEKLVEEAFAVLYATRRERGRLVAQLAIAACSSKDVTAAELRCYSRLAVVLADTERERELGQRVEAELERLCVELENGTV